MQRFKVDGVSKSFKRAKYLLQFLYSGKDMTELNIQQDDIYSWIHWETVQF